MCVRSNLYNDRCFPIAHNDHNQPVLRRHPRHCIRLSDGTEEPGAPFNRHSSVFRLRNRRGAFPGTDTQAVVSPETASRSSHPRFTGRHGTRMSPATVSTGILPPQNNASAHGEGAFACCLLLRHKNETIPHITDMQDHCFMLRNLTQQKRPSEKDLVSGKRDSDPRPQPWQGCALKPPKRYAFRGNQLSYFLLRRFSRMCFTSFFALVKRMVKYLRLSAGL